jgi:hypothetical protein
MGIGHILIGVACGFILVPALPEMLASALNKYPGRLVEITDLSAGIFNSCLGIG